MKKINKKDLAKIVGNKLGTSHKEGKQVLQTVLETVTECLQEDVVVELRNFGTFRVREYGERNGRNPKTGEKFIIPPKTKVLFKAGKKLRSEVQV